MNNQKVQDSGNRVTFEGGGQKDYFVGKGRCDLIPLEVFCQHGPFENPILCRIGEFIRANKAPSNKANRLSLLYDIMNRFVCDSGVTNADMLLELSLHYEAGAQKYSDRNWEQGIPTSSLINSAIRHYCKYMRGDKDEPHHRAFLWNLLGCAWMLTYRPEYDDLPGPVQTKEQDKYLVKEE